MGASGSFSRYVFDRGVMVSLGMAVVFLALLFMAFGIGMGGVLFVLATLTGKAADIPPLRYGARHGAGAGIGA